MFPREGADGQWLLGWPVVVGTHSQAEGFAVTRSGVAVVATQLAAYIAGTAAVAWRQRANRADPRI